MAALATRYARQTPAKAVHAGLNTALFRVSLSVSYSSGDTYQLGRLPNGARLVRAIGYRNSADPNAALLLGTSAAPVAFAALSFSGAERATFLATPLTPVSATASDRNQGVPLVMTASFGVSTGHAADIAIQYVMDSTPPPT